MSRAWWFAMIFASCLAGCVTYGGIAKAADGKVYITGTTGFLVFSSSFVKRCTESGSALSCDSLTVNDAAAAADDDSSSDSDSDSDAKPKKKKKKKPAADDQ